MRPVLLLPLLLSTAAPAAAPPTPRAPLEEAARAMGGLERLRALRALRLEGIGHRVLLEQSERPEGPWAVMYEQRVELRDLAQGRVREETEQRSGAVGLPAWTKGPVSIMADGVAAMERGGQRGPAGATQLAEAQERLALSPERVLLTALDAKDLAKGADEPLQGVPHHVLTFTWERGTEKVPVRLYLNANTHLPTAVETLDAFPADPFWSVWGDVRTRTLFSQWSLLPGGLLYPQQLDVERNGVPSRSLSYTAVQVDPALEASAFALAPELRPAFEARRAQTLDTMPLGNPRSPPAELAPGVVQLPGAWNVALVAQEDGVVVLEAPLASGYSAKVLEEAARRFPGKRVKAVVSTSDAWPHIGGLREYVARGVPVYLLDLNRSIVQRLLLAPHTRVPDALQRTLRRADLRIVSAKTSLGSGPNRLELFPIRSESGERMLMAWLPGQRLLYGSDLVQRGPEGGFFAPQYLAELSDAAAREGVKPERVFAMHTGAIPWTEVVAAVSQARGEGKPLPSP
ncbi:MBL fold metallo-hydrolase [Aggregicoccus sp. 17bor-14]|uniref:MBL fold metallo-hydrolase n=1 Tax=Myxococcaceae TaxID=31 RepID=UPI00129CEF60|nr:MULTISPECIES: MBL fold metallo-hydrolase [Myxococcaceae]MBF5041699.1 MBL fold metallo-hydrolase [Simulacricoccus sp. 17bor-14]MRI87481.1 MBL fold metallo-hydrolase [Aggregicoccus sp. 17bor-14]